MATLHQIIEKRREVGRLRGIASQGKTRNERLQAALDFGPIRSIEPVHIQEVYTRNPRTGVEHHIDIWHEPGNGNDRYTVYFDGGRWHRPWSRTALIDWLFPKIDPVRRDWD